MCFIACIFRRNCSNDVSRLPGLTKKEGYRFGNPRVYILDETMELPYDYSLSHHQLLFNVCISYGTNMEIFILKKTFRMIFLHLSQ
jgi:hypothetical protein